MNEEYFLTQLLKFRCTWMLLIVDDEKIKLRWKKKTIFRNAYKKVMSTFFLLNFIEVLKLQRQKMIFCWWRYKMAFLKDEKIQGKNTLFFFLMLYLSLSLPPILFSFVKKCYSACLFVKLKIKDREFSKFAFDTPKRNQSKNIIIRWILNCFSLHLWRGVLCKIWKTF